MLRVNAERTSAEGRLDEENARIVVNGQVATIQADIHIK